MALVEGSLFATGAGEIEKPRAGLAGVTDGLGLKEKPAAGLAKVGDLSFSGWSPPEVASLTPPKMKPPPPPLGVKPPTEGAAAGGLPADASTFLPPNVKPPVLAKTGIFGGSRAAATFDDGGTGAVEALEGDDLED